MPPMPPGIPAGIAGAPSSSGESERTHSVVNSMLAIDAAFSIATRATLVGSITPAWNKFSYLSKRALYPKSFLPSFTF
jgi:hypothetical protein